MSNKAVHEAYVKCLDAGGAKETPIEKITNESISDDPPEYFSWRDYQGEDWTTPAKDQGSCGACSVFGAIGSLESVIKIREGYADFDPNLSEQYVLSCLREAADFPGIGICFGGSAANVFKYIMETTPEGNDCNGIILESCFPYQASDDVPCSDKCEDWQEYLVPIIDYGFEILDGSIDERELIKNMVMEKGPVAVSSKLPFFFYSPELAFFNPFGGFGNDVHDPNAYFPAGRSYFNIIGHYLLIVGWKDNESISNGGYWMCKNSWGTDWGYDGFVNIEYGALSFDCPCIINKVFEHHIVWVDYDPESYKWPFET